MPLKRGDSGSEVQALAGFLSSIGYLPTEPKVEAYARTLETPATEFDSALEEALRAFQEAYGLDVTGRVDDPTLELMLRPRCVKPDIVGLRTLTSAVWTHSPLSYAFASYCPELGEQDTVQVIESALGRWSAVCTLGFVRVAHGTADLVFSWASGDHGDKLPEYVFSSAPAQTFGHGFYPPPLGGNLAGQVHFNNAEQWSRDSPASGSADLETIATHEIGHALGIRNHLNGSQLNVMHATFSWGLVRRTLTAADIAAIQALYGPP